MNNKPFLFKFFLIITILCNTMKAQEIGIVKDSICKGQVCFEINELTIPEKNYNVYLDIQKVYNIFNTKYFKNFNDRFEYKKTFIKQSSLENLKENQYGTEQYTLFFQRNNIVSCSIGLQVFGSSWEDLKYYCLDLANNKVVGKDLFINQKELLKKCRLKLLDYDLEFSIKEDSLSNYILLPNSNGKVEKIIFLFYDFNSRSNSGYSKYEVSFNKKEIKKYISKKYLKKIF